MSSDVHDQDGYIPDPTALCPECGHDKDEHSPTFTAGKVTGLACTHDCYCRLTLAEVDDRA
mgnify:CR=1 FL=1